jgi:hypothetical protein
MDEPYSIKVPGTSSSSLLISEIRISVRETSESGISISSTLTVIGPSLFGIIVITLSPST